ncbi:LOW QUALITY PROTEIN: hypothetical protein MAR_021363 [Mya arenaria]|uniref:Uncharacterized protein n=1 Tax=Mya arenaria TaxID=6604 RepID=A0ABY7EA33_MYAAR|nr:LOW QUALITY PROTEIN: hypothetical protein MAR_021363 [Mya arenaria]
MLMTITVQPCSSILNIVELKTDGVLFCADDKAKVPIGEPDRPVSTGVRGRQSIAPVDIELSSLDHDMKMSSLTPSVVLKCRVPDTVQQSFVRGQVTTFINDTVTQTSSPFRHAAHIVKILESNQETNPKVLLKYTDGGTDQRNTLEQVKCANICLFQELNLDMLITVRCAPGQSYVNPAERIMSILNYGLQNVATERQKLDEETEKKLNRCNGMSSVRELLKKEPDLEPKWVESIEPIQSLIENRFMRLRLKDEPIRCLTPVSDAEIDLLKRHLRELFPDLDLDKLQKVHTNRCAEYVDWKTRHCRETQYTFQVRKCSNSTCCPPKQLGEEKLMWLPEPELDETREHFLNYEEAKQKETTEKDRPSLQVQKVKKTTNQPRTAVSNESRQENSNEPRPGNSTVTRPENSEESRSGGNSTLVNEEPVEINRRVDVPLSTQNARAIATCIECRKPRVVYSKTKLSQRKEVLLATCLSDYDYSCGAQLFPPSAPSTLKSSVVIRPFLQCASPIELCYYGADLGRKDLCTYCADLESETDAELKKLYKTVLPICQKCRELKKEPIVQRKYGKPKSK